MVAASRPKPGSIQADDAPAGEKSGCGHEAAGAPAAEYELGITPEHHLAERRRDGIVQFLQNFGSDGPVGGSAMVRGVRSRAIDVVDAPGVRGERGGVDAGEGRSQGRCRTDAEHPEAITHLPDLDGTEV